MLRKVYAITDAALAGLDVDDLLRVLLERVADLLRVDTAAILLLDPTGRELVATAAIGLEEEVRQRIRVPVGSGFSGRVAAIVGPVIIDHVDHTTVFSQVLIDKHLAGMAGVPMLVEGHVTGVLHVGTLTSRQFSDEDITLLRMVADRAAVAVQARSSQLERTTTLALQRSLLPTRLPDVPGLQAASRYIAGASAGVGGDWFDLFELPTGHVVMTIGDVAGSGLRAAVIMGRLRSALRAYALEHHDPAETLSRLDRKIQFFEPDVMATVCYAVIAPDRTRVAVSSAGHPPPILLGPAGAVVAVVPPDLPLGVRAAAARRVTLLELPPGGGLLLYTDGLIERHHVEITDAITALAADLSAYTGTLDAAGWCQIATDRLADDPAVDDVAILAVTRRLPPDGRPVASRTG
jgi:putative methionine-R-sulfoxide reductase with GAF domain